MRSVKSWSARSRLGFLLVYLKTSYSHPVAGTFPIFAHTIQKYAPPGSPRPSSSLQREKKRTTNQQRKTRRYCPHLPSVETRLVHPLLRTLSSCCRPTRERPETPSPRSITFAAWKRKTQNSDGSSRFLIVPYSLVTSLSFGGAQRRGSS